MTQRLPAKRLPIPRIQPHRLLIVLAVVGAALSVAVAPAHAAISYPRTAPMILQNVTIDDIQANRHRICDGRFTHVMKNTNGELSAKAYLDAAQACGLKVIFHFSETVNTSTGTVYPSRVAYWVNLVKAHPALWGYLSVKEPSWSGISASEIRSLYSAYRKADPNHWVVALFGDIPHFGQSVNPYTHGMANVVMVNWYPVETTNGTNTIYQTGAATWFPKVRNHVQSVIPGQQIWLMVQTHKYLAPQTHKKQRPSLALLDRQVREGFGYLRAGGIAFHTWTNANYNIDEQRDPQMVDWMIWLSARVRNGTFQ